MFSNQVDRFKRREEEDRSGGASRGLSYNKEPVSYNRGESYNSPGGTLRGGYQGGRSREGGGGGSERRNLRLDDRTGRLAKEHLHRSPLLLFVFCCLIHLYLIVMITCSKKAPERVRVSTSSCRVFADYFKTQHPTQKNRLLQKMLKSETDKKISNFSILPFD